MHTKTVKIAAGMAAAMLVFSNINIKSFATGTALNGINSVLPSGGVNLTLAKGPSLDSLQGSDDNHKIEPTLELSSIEDIQAATAGSVEELEEEGFKNLVIAQVDRYVNVRSIPSEEGEIVGKLYDDSVGTFLSEQDGWYEIQSGSVTGYVKGEYCVTGEAAVELAKQVGTRIAVVDTTTLFVREEPTTESSILGMVPDEEELLVTEELDGWVKVNIEEGDGYVSTEYVNLKTEFVEAESREEEEARLKKEEEARRKAQEAARASQAAQTQDAPAGQESTGGQAVSYSGDGSMGSSVVEYALQFVGNPYVYGGTSLTNGADCSGFVMSVYANFGVSLPHSSTADRSQGYAVDGLENAIPGDLVCYSGHVGIYIGNGQIVHASTSKTGIVVGNASYRKVLAVRRIFLPELLENSDKNHGKQRNCPLFVFLIKGWFQVRIVQKY